LRDSPLIAVCLLAFSILAPLVAAGQSFVLNIPRVSKPPKLQDFLDNRPREAELAVTEFWQYMPGDGVPVSQPTTVYLSYDDKNLYVAFDFRDDPKQIRATVAKRELIMSDDRISICIDTFHDHRRMYWFDVNPYGIQADGNVTDGVEDDPSWDTLWHSEAKITPGGYVGLASIPFKSIRFPNAPDQTWGLILGRWIMRNNEFSLWPKASRQRPGFVQQGGDLAGLRSISPGRNVQLIPYGMFSRARYLDQSGPAPAFFRTENEGRAGLDAKFVAKDAFTLDLTLNPDFSQVESDEPQVTVNQRFEVYFPEKRPFFLENAGFFKTPQRLFFSRRIADPEFGARLTGKVGKWALGALAVDDRGPGRSVSPDDPCYGAKSMIGVARLQREFSRTTNIAAMVTSEDFGDTYNRVFSLDTRVQPLRNWIFTGQAMTSNSRLDDGTRLAGPAYYGAWEHSGKHLISESWYMDRSPDFRAELGYFHRVDVRQGSNSTGYMWRPEGMALVAFGPVLQTMVNYDRQGRLQDWSINPTFRLELTRMTRLTFEREEFYELYSGLGFRKHRNNVRVSSQLTKRFSFQSTFANGTGVNYHPAAGLSPSIGDMTEVSAGVTLRPVPRLRLDETYLYSALRSPQDESVFHNHIFRSKANFQFNREMSLRTIIDYSSVLPNPALVNLEKEEHLGLDVLFTYMLNPGTAFHAGYTDLYDNLCLNPSLSPSLCRTNSPDLNTGRQFFVKLSYLFRF
jgi:hypothetical protein